MPQARRAKSPARSPGKKTSVETTQNFVAGGVGSGSFFVPIVVTLLPTICQLLAYLTSPDAKALASSGATGLASACYAQGAASCASSALSAALTIAPTWEAARFLGVFGALAYALDVLLPGPLEKGPETSTGHVPTYVDNGLVHCFLFTSLFALGGAAGWYKFGIFYDLFAPCITILNLSGYALSTFLYFKGLYFPSTRDSGTTGSLLEDFAWGTELYPRVLWGTLDIKRWVNCRFSMTYWQLAGLSFAWKSYELHGGAVDYGLLLSALSQYLYLVKFFMWEIGYMRSIDIIVDRAGFEIQWGCLVWVPAVYTLHTRFLVQHPSGLSLPVAAAIFAVGLAGVYLNYVADVQRQEFREKDGKMLIWGRKPQYVTAKWGGKGAAARTSLLLADGWWGPARHFHYVFELTAAWSWCLLANPIANGALPLFYATFLTILLLNRAKRDEDKCLAKYGDGYKELMRLVPYRVVPGVY